MVNEKLKIYPDEMKAVWMPEEVHQALKKVADEEGVKIHNLVARLINNYRIYQNERTK